MKLTKSEKLIILMLCDIQEKMGVQGDFDAKFIKSAIFAGQSWALDWQYGAALHDEDSNPKIVGEVCDILDMWEALEIGYEDLSSADKARVASEADPFGKDIRFRGFDGNRESGHLGVARFLVESMGRYSRFVSRDLNSHGPSIEMYRRMLNAYKSLNLAGDQPDANQIIAVLKECVHPSRRT